MSPTSQEGQILGNYRVLKNLGIGGMGAVYLAEHTMIGKRVALKILHDTLSADREVLTRFFNEARAVNRIGSEHVVEIHDIGQTPDGGHYFVMEYLDGRTLGEILRVEGALAIADALHIAAQIAKALAAAHACAIVHRDLKPENIMVLSPGPSPGASGEAPGRAAVSAAKTGVRGAFVKVLDFGLAKMLAESSEQGITAQGVVLGTPHYMAPEVCEGRKDIDHCADIYSLGVLLFQMTTGRLPFDSLSAGGILLKHISEPPTSPRSINPSIPPQLEQIILCCMEKSPASRFSDMGSLRAALLSSTRFAVDATPVPSAAPADPAAQRGASPRPQHLVHRGGPEYHARHGLRGHTEGTMAGAPSSSSASWRFLARIMPPTWLASRPRRILFWLSLGLAAAMGAAIVLAIGLGSRQAPSAPISIADTPERPAKGMAMPATKAPVLEQISVRLITRPSGASVSDRHGNVLGHTPATIVLPRDGGEHLLIFRHPRAEERRKIVVADSDSEVELELIAR